MNNELAVDMSDRLDVPTYLSNIWFCLTSLARILANLTTARSAA